MKSLEKVMSWDDADRVLAELAAQHRDLAVLTVWRDEQVQKARDEYARLEAPIKARIEALEDELHRWTLTHQDELDTRSRTLTHGRVGLRLVQDLVVRNAKRAIDWLLEHKQAVYVRVKYELNKELLQQEAEDTLLKACGIRRRSRDVWFYEVDGARGTRAD